MIKNPDSTKKTSTPLNPPEKPGSPTWNLRQIGLRLLEDHQESENDEEKGAPVRFSLFQFT
jgi:hypothetical protein